MNGGKKPHGFTIIEVLIFLAVSGVIFVSALTLLNGKQQRTEFSTGIAQLTSQLQSTVGNVASGYYNLPTNYSCSGNQSGPNIDLNGSQAVGTNGDCTFIGEVIQFYSSGNGVDPTIYKTFPVVGLHYQNDTPPNDAASLADAKPQTLNGLGVSTPLPYGIQVHPAGLSYTNAGATNNDLGAIGLFTTFNGISSGNSSGGSGAQSVQLVPIPGSSLSSQSPVNEVNTLTDSCLGQTNTVCLGSGGAEAPKNPDGGVSICFDSGSTGESGLITLGGSNNPTTVSLKRFSNKGCV